MYGSLIEADEYFATRLHNFDWSNASNDDKTRALNQAQEIIDQFLYRGEKTDPDQEGEWPRDGETETPLPIRRAGFLIAQALISGRDPEADVESVAVRAAKYGELSTAYDRSGNILDHVAHLVPSPLAWNLIVPFLYERNKFTLKRSS